MRSRICGIRALQVRCRKGGLVTAFATNGRRVAAVVPLDVDWRLEYAPPQDRSSRKEGPVTAPRQFCTLFDRNYLVKGVAMLRSIALHSPGARIRVLCMDDTTQALLRHLAIPGVVTLPLAAVETEDVLAAKKTRSISEYCWTLSAVLMWHVIQSDSDIDLLTYLDADLLFFSSVEPVFDDIGSASIAAIEHRYTARLAHLAVYGRFNVQWVSIRRDAEGLACLKKWRDQCVEWCFAVVEDGKLGDQKYLDAWPDEYPHFHSVRHVGAGVAPWNYPRYRISASAGRLYVDAAILVFYHFHQFQMLDGGRYDYCSSNYTQDGPPPELIYGKYREALVAALADIHRLEPAFKFGFRAAPSVTARRFAQRFLPLAVKNALRRVRARMS